VTEPAAVTTVDRVGPGGGVASDSAFGVALVTLWQRCAEAGDPVGFAVPVDRGEIAARAAGLVDEIKTGRVVAVAANRTRRLIGVAFLRPGRGTGRHTGHLPLILVDPDHRRAGLGGTLVRQVIAAAGVERIDAVVAADSGGEMFLRSVGFAEWGRRPGWIFGADGVPVDDVVMGATP
jgi:GNAT superfamily N-acetyltransferase